MGTVVLLRLLAVIPYGVGTVEAAVIGIQVWPLRTGSEAGTRTEAPVPTSQRFLSWKRHSSIGGLCATHAPSINGMALSSRHGLAAPEMSEEFTGVLAARRRP